MIRQLSIVLSLLFLIFASCEDKEKSTNININTPVNTEKQEKDTLKIEVKEDSIKDKSELKVSDYPVLAQEELIPFLTQFGKDNPENQVKIITSFGDIEVQLFNDTPLHRANFIYLTKRGYFDGTYFHRVAKGFVIQGGNSDNRETSDKRNKIGAYLIPSEFDAGHWHTRGAFAAAKYAEQNVSKASSPFEFYIVQSQNGAHHLDNDHTVFGQVIKGMDVVDTIANQRVGEGEWPLLNIRMKVEIIE
jgi:peptidylprolyl isomerase